MLCVLYIPHMVGNMCVLYTKRAMKNMMKTELTDHSLRGFMSSKEWNNL